MSLIKKLFSPIIWGNLLVMALTVVVLAIGVWVGLGVYTHHGEEIIVPDVEGKLFGDAEYTLAMLGLEAVVVDSTYNRAVPSGAVMIQLPKGGSKVKSGREIYLTINSRESPSVSFPDIADNCSMREAQDHLQQLGFRLGPMELVPGDKDWVYGVKCRGRLVMTGERVPTDAMITLLVGSGQQEEFFDYDDEEEEDKDNDDDSQDDSDDEKPEPFSYD